MVRSFILNDNQRQAIEDYIENRPNVMTSQIRQLRLRVKKLDYDQMSSDLELLGRLRDLKIPKGRKAKDVAAGFTVVQKWDLILDEFIESNEQVSILSLKDEPYKPNYVRTMLNAKIVDRKLLVKAGVRNNKVYLERTGKDIAAGFTVRKPGEKDDVAASFEIKTEPVTFVTSGLDIKNRAPEKKK